MTRIFLSYHSPDQAVAQSLASKLQNEDTEVFFAPWALRPGAFWQPELASAIDAADAFIMLLGAQSPGPWQLLEYYAAIDRRAASPEFALVPVLLTGEAPRLPFLSALHIVKLPDPSSPGAVDQLHAACAGEPLTPADAPWQLVNPYRGLHALRAADADFFFGREALTRDVIERMRHGERCVWLVGNSGVGKSSIVDAGVVAALRRQQLPGEGTPAWPSDLEDSRAWLFLVMTPGEEPLYNLARAFVSQWTDVLDPRRGELAMTWAESLQSKQGLRGLLRAAREAFELSHGVPPARFVLSIDQGEELYTRSSTSTRSRFSELIAEGLDEPELQIIASIRSDHYGNLQNDAVLFPRTSRVDVPPLSEVALRQVVSEPAAKLGANFSDTAMVNMIASSAVGQPGALPLLSYLMEDMWKTMQARGDGVLQWSDHPELVGVHRVLAQRAHHFLETCDDEQRNALKRLFTLKLAHVPLEGAAVRRRASKQDCSAMEWELVEALSGERWRLLTTSEEAGEPSAEVAHEILLHEWDALRGWLAEEHEFLRWKGQLEHDRRVWEEAGKDIGALLQGVKLVQAESWLSEREDDLTPAERDFVSESVASRDREAAHRASQRRRLKALAAVVLLTLILGGGAVYLWRAAESERGLAVDQREWAEKQRKRAEEATARATDACKKLERILTSTHQIMNKTSSTLEELDRRIPFGIISDINDRIARLSSQANAARKTCPEIKFNNTDER